MTYTSPSPSCQSGWFPLWQFSNNILWYLSSSSCQPGWREREAALQLSWITSMPSTACTPGILASIHWNAHNHKLIIQFLHLFCSSIKFIVFLICHEPAVTAAIFARYILTMSKFSDKSEPGSEATVQEKAILKHLEVQGRQITMTTHAPSLKSALRWYQGDRGERLDDRARLNTSRQGRLACFSFQSDGGVFIFQSDGGVLSSWLTILFFPWNCSM